MEANLKVTPKRVVIVAAVLILVLLVATCQWRSAEDRRRAEEIATAEGLAQVLTATFAGRTDLKVSDIRGTIDVTSVDRGPIFKSTQKATLPFSVDYFVDLSRLDLEDARFNQESQTLTIEVPTVRVAEPNIDLTKGTVGTAEGFWVSRRAGATLVQRALNLTRAQAEKTANKPENLRKAAEEGRQRIQALLEVPLQAAGRSDVRVVVRYPQEGRADSERWDVGPSIQEVLTDRS